MSHRKRPGNTCRAVTRLLTILALAVILGGWRSACALDAALDINEYAHTAWTVRDGFSLGNIYAMAQTPDGYLWLGSEFGLFRFDGDHTVLWQPPGGLHLPNNAVNALLVTHDGTLWIGTFAGLVTWDGRKLTQWHAFDGRFVTALYQDRAGTVWVGTMESPARLCALRDGRARCYGARLNFGAAVWTIHEDDAGTLWAGAQTGLWRIAPGAPRRIATAQALGGAVLPSSGPVGLTHSGDGRLLVAVHNAGLMQLAGDEVQPYPIRVSDSNRLLRDRDGSLWVGTIERGLTHIHDGRTDTFTQSDGLSGDIVLSLFEDREGSVWVSTTGGLDRFRELAVSTLSVRQGLPSDVTGAVLAAADGSVWIGTHDGLTQWNNGRVTTYLRASGLPDDSVQSLFQDHSGRIWAFTDGGLGYLEHGRFIATPGVAGGEVNSITGDDSGNLWLSGQQSLLHLRAGRLLERIPWSAFGLQQNVSVLLSDPQRGGLWLGFWQGGGVAYFKDGRVRASYTAADGLSRGQVADLRLENGALWVATMGGVSRLEHGRIATLTSRNGLPCDNAMWTLEDNQHALWVYTACGLVRIERPQLEAWIADPEHRIRARILGPQDGVRLRSISASSFAPRAALGADGKIWFLSGGGVQVLDPDHIVFNRLPPPVHIEQVIADGRLYWQDLRDGTAATLRLPPRSRDLEIDYEALSLVAPEANQFRYRLDGRDRGWYDAGNRRLALYTDLPPGEYRFQVIASNNSGVWNEQGAAIEFAIAPMFWQTPWFRIACGIAFLALLLALHRLRARQLALQFNRTLDARVHERTRIARDLHDTLLQSFQGVLLQFGAALRLLGREPQKAREVLAGAIEQAGHAIREGREAVQGLRMSVEESSDLAAPIARLARELAAERQGAPAPSVRIEVQGTVRALHPIERDEIFRIAAEALRNAVHHSQGTQIEVELRYDAREFRLRVRDDGRGTDPRILAADRTGHYGLRGMRERAALAGGKLALWSAPNAGMEVELIIPASRVYPAARRRDLPASS
ncbi:MAG TPA: two-component regulator propeller domain-containing protein [Steroidobacteraceae bacterium]|nr:two-component regulator propeller domain-containing protein [Steroidobacteraceae bacterium]